MPIYSATVVVPTQFDGLTAATGLFDAIAVTNFNSTGGEAIQVRINTINFSGASAITTWALSTVNPGVQTCLYLTGTGVDAAVGNLGVLPTNPGGTPWHLSWVTTGMTGEAVLSIDFDYVVTEG